MDVGDRFFRAWLAGFWGIFMLWELQIQSMSESLVSQIIRYDLLVLPILLLFTAYTCYANRKKRNT